MEKVFVKFGLLCFLFLAVKSVKRPLSVTRDVLDSFRVDEFSCEADKRICTRRNALCRPDGSCMCRNNTPDYVNPKINVNNGYLSQGVIDGCMAVAPVVDTIDPYNLACSYSFRPYQIVPNSHEGDPIWFIHSAGTHYSSCNFSNAIVKYPSVKSWQPLTWLNESDISINMTYVGILLFGWRVPVPRLKGLMVVINLRCSRIELNHSYHNDTISEQCLRMKVRGTTYSSAIRTSDSEVRFPLFVFIGILVSYSNT